MFDEVTNFNTIAPLYICMIYDCIIIHLKCIPIVSQP